MIKDWITSSETRDTIRGFCPMPTAQTLQKKARRIFARHGGMLRTGKAIRLGIRPRTLYKLRNGTGWIDWGFQLRSRQSQAMDSIPPEEPDLGRTRWISSGDLGRSRICRPATFRSGDRENVQRTLESWRPLGVKHSFQVISHSGLNKDWPACEVLKPNSANASTAITVNAICPEYQTDQSDVSGN
jgi:hypothetical protein